MKRIAVFCASSDGNIPVYKDTAYDLGKYLAANDFELVYGGSNVGLMGAVADGALQNNGKAIGVLPTFLKHKELAHIGLTTLIEVENMHERKMKMHELSDAVITLPGGYGTFEELFEMLTWAQLKLHFKPIGLLNVNGFYDPLVQMVQNMLSAGLLRPEYEQLLIVRNDITSLIAAMKAYKPLL